MHDLDLVERDHDGLALVRSIHDGQDLDAERLLARRDLALVVLEQHETGVFTLNGDPLDHLLDLVEVRRDLVIATLALIDFFDLLFVLILSLFQKVEVLLLQLLDVLLNDVIFGKVQELRLAQRLGLRQLLHQEEGIILLFNVFVLEYQEQILLLRGCVWLLVHTDFVVGSNALCLIAWGWWVPRRLQEHIHAHQDELHFLQILLKLSEA